MSEAKRHFLDQPKRFIGAGLAAGGLALGLSGCTTTATYSYKHARLDALRAYKDAWRRASPAGRFVLQYIEPTVVQERYKDISLEDGDKNYEITINNGCLGNTAYDIAGGSIKGYFRGLFSSGEINGRVPTAAANAYVSSDNPDVITIESGHASSHDLRFSGVDGDGPLQPMDQQTRDVLATNGCEIGVVNREIVQRYGQRNSPWVKGHDYRS
jgi:hypothetical protein